MWTAWLLAFVYYNCVTTSSGNCSFVFSTAWLDIDVIKHHQIIVKRDQFIIYGFNVQMHLWSITALKIKKIYIYLTTNTTSANSIYKPHFYLSMVFHFLFFKYFHSDCRSLEKININSQPPGFKFPSMINKLSSGSAKVQEETLKCVFLQLCRHVKLTHHSWVVGLACSEI